MRLPPVFIFRSNLDRNMYRHISRHRRRARIQARDGERGRARERDRCGCAGERGLREAAIGRCLGAIAHALRIPEDRRTGAERNCGGHGPDLHDRGNRLHCGRSTCRCTTGFTPVLVSAQVWRGLLLQLSLAAAGAGGGGVPT